MLKHELVFQSQIAKNKPETIRHPHNACPFCDTEALTDIIEQRGDMIWLMNKFPTLAKTTQTVLIESHRHDGDFSNYSATESRDIIRFALAAWQQLLSDPRYQSVLMYKNFGPLSGGSLTHPHLQIVGLEEVDGYENIGPENFTGPTVIASDHCCVTLSDQPVLGFVEANILIDSVAASDKMADAIRVLTHYFLTDYNRGRCHSYNLFFYRQKAHLICKVVPRYPTSPYAIGYKLVQVNNDARVAEISAQMRAQFEAFAH